MSTMNRGLLDRVWNSVTESQIWRSIFRHGYPDTPLNQSLVMMGNVFLHLHPVKVSRKAMKITYTWCLGGLSFFLFLVLTITGVFLMFYFVPEQSVAYCEHPADQQRDDVWQSGAQHASLVGAPDGGDGDAAHDSRLLPRRLQAATRVQLGHRRGVLPDDSAAELHWLSAAVGSDWVLGDHRRLEHGQLRATAWARRPTTS